MRMPQGQVTAITYQPTPPEEGESIRRNPQDIDELNEPEDAGTARVRAHSRSAETSSARVVERGTVWLNASISNCVLRTFFSE